MTFFEGLSLTVPSIVTAMGWYVVKTHTIYIEQKKVRDQHKMKIVEEIWQKSIDFTDTIGDLSRASAKVVSETDEQERQKKIKEYFVAKSLFIKASAALIFQIEMSKYVHNEMNYLSPDIGTMVVAVKDSTQLFEDDHSTQGQLKLAIDTCVNNTGPFLRNLSEKMLKEIFAELK